MEKLIKSLRNQGVYISYIDNSLKINFDGDQIPDEILLQLKENKDQLITYLKSIQSQNTFKVIPKVEVNNSKYQLSSSQKRLWVVSQLPDASVAYNMPFSAPLSLEYSDLKLMEKSVEYVVSRHESLRTIFTLDEDGEVFQKIVTPDELDFHIGYHDFTEFEEKEELMQNFIAEDSIKPFDLERGPLFRMHFFELTESEKYIYYNLHHIITDEWSMEVLRGDIFQVYEAFRQGKLPDLPTLTIQYKDYAAWQLNYLTTNDAETSKQYWKEKIAGDITPINLPTSKIRPKTKTYSGKRLRTYLDIEATEALKTLVKKNGGSLFMVFVSSLKALLYKYTNQKDIIIGIPVAGRDHADLESQIGFYLNTIILRNTINAERSFEHFYETVKVGVLQAFTHQEYPFDKILEEVNQKRDLSRNVLFDILLDYHKSSDVEISHNLSKETKDVGYRPAKYDLEFHITEFENNIGITIDFNTDIYEDHIIHQFIGHYKNFLGNIQENSTKSISEIELLSNSEKLEIIENFNDTKKESTLKDTVLTLIDKQVKLSEQKIALEDENSKISFKELEVLSNQFADCLLKEHNLQKGDRVGIKMKSENNLIIAILGILKLGGVFVPLDPKHTSDRQKYIIEDSELKLMVTTTEFMFDFMEYETPLLSMDVEFDPVEFNPEFPVKMIHKEDPVYIIYTSGSTGKPKGVEISHGSLYNYIDWSQNYYLNGDLKNYDFGLFTSLSFDLTITSLFLPLVSGGRLRVFNESKDITQSLREYINESISGIKLTPAHINLLGAMEFDSINLQIAIVGGDVLTATQIDVLRKLNPKIKIYNEYGPTETTVGCIVKEIGTEQEEITIGRPIANTQIYILDEGIKTTPKGVTGEIYIGGNGLAMGYINNEELTKSKFVQNPFGEGKLYKTGDLGIWKSNGEIQFKGRKDDQVKINGFRIELGEIEYHLTQKPEIQQAIVLVKEKNEEKYLEAFVTTQDDCNTKELQIYLRQILPEYMVPSVYYQLSELPLTLNGKVDKKELQKYNGEQVDSGVLYVAPESEKEQKAAKIWEEELKHSPIGIEDSFFDLGGDSIRAIRVLSKMNKVFDDKFELVDLFENSTIRTLLKNAGESEKLYDEVLKEEVKESLLSYYIENYEEDPIIEDVYPMSDIEIGMCYSYTVQKEKSVYHDQFTYPINIAKFDMNTFRRAMDLMIEKHDILRTAYNIFKQKTPLRLIYKNIPSKVTFEDISNQEKDNQKVYIEEYMVSERANNPFEVDDPGIWRMKIFKLDIDHYFMVFQFHHAIFDGWSRASLITELNNTYYKLQEDINYEPKEIKLNYKDYIVEQEYLKKSNKVDEFWKNYLKEYDRVSLFTNNIVHEETFQIIEGEQYAELKNACLENNLSVRSVIHAAYIFVLSKLTLQDDLITGVVTNGRPLDEEGDQLLGCFLNTIPFRTVFKQTDILSYVNDITINLNEQKRYENLSLATLHQRYSQETGGENPFFDSIFSCIDFHIYKEANNYESTNNSLFYINRFEMTNTYLDVLALPNDDSITIQWIRNKELKSGKTNEDLSRICLKFINAFIKKPNQQLSELNILEKNEQVKLNGEFLNTTARLHENDHFIKAFLNQVKETPNNIALVYNDKEWSYQDLNVASSKLANCLLIEKKLKIGELVGVKLDASPNMIISILAILKAGCAYVPLSINSPVSREKYIIEDSQLKLIITDTDRIFKLSYFEGNLFAIDIEFDEANYSQGFTHNITNQSQLAYVIYTSGSTGMPKGTLIEHKSMINYLNWAKKTYVLPNEIKDFGLFTPLSFDLTVTSLFLPLMSGGKLYIYEDIRDVTVNLSSYMLDKISAIKLTPAHIKLLGELSIVNNDLQVAIVGGDTLHSNHVKILKEIAPNVKIYNEYGPTETTVGCTAGVVESSSNITIGKPIDNTQIYILDRFNKIQPVGVPGEICIGGFGLARAYLNNLELTNEKFVENPFITGERMYKTGDIGKWRDNGEIEYIGRNDDQVKIRGYRIEPKDIQSQLIDKENIDDAAVLVHSIGQENELIAYIVSEEEQESKELRNYLKDKVPEYMIPNKFVQLPIIPLTNNGKIDKKTLLKNKSIEVQSGIEYVAPIDDLEKQLIDIWERILEKDKIGVKDDYFLLGGNSLLAIKLVNEYHSLFKIHIQLPDILVETTVQGHKKLILSKGISMNTTEELDLEKETLEF